MANASFHRDPIGVFSPSRALRAVVAALVAILLLPEYVCGAQSAPPRTISDITALLDQQEPDPMKIQELKTAATREPPAGADKDALARFYHERAQAAELLGMVARQIEDLRRARDLAPVGSNAWRAIGLSLGVAEEFSGNYVNAIQLFDQLLDRSVNVAQRHTVYTVNVRLNLEGGNIDAARSSLRNAEAMLFQFKKSPYWETQGDLSIGQFENARAQLLEVEGKYRDAEVAFRTALAAFERLIPVATKVLPGSVTVETLRIGLDIRELSLAQNLVLQGRLAEAELVVRNVLTRTLSHLGRYAPRTAQAVGAFAAVLVEQGRARDAEAMAKAAIDIHKQIGSAPESRELAQTRRMLGSALVLQSHWPDAIAVYEEMRSGLAKDPALLEVLAYGDVNWMLALIKSNRAGEAVKLLEPRLKATSEQLGNDNYQTAERRGFLALALAESGRREQALAEFQEAVKVLLSRGKVSGEEREASPARARRLTWILDGYIKLLYDIRNEQNGFDAAAEAFRVADAARGQSVQQALAASAARAAAGTPALAELMRREQDVKQQLPVLYATLLRVLNAPADQQLPQVAKQMRARIAELEKEQRALLVELEQRFPTYANLINPQPASVEQARAGLREGEALLSVLVTADRTYVWAVPKQGPVTFHAAGIGEAEVNRVVAQLRHALDPGDVAIDRLPEFDLAQAAKLYDALLKPVQGAWTGARNLMVVANGALAQLPFGILPTSANDSSADQGLRFEHYKAVPWLIRQVAVTQLPAVNTLVTLRALPAGNAARSVFAGFGDPQFGAQAPVPAQEQVAVHTRNLGIRRVTEAALRDGSAPVNYIAYGALPPLPDTREEILSIAAALKADVNKDVFLGAAASKQNAKSTDLSQRRIIAFATHGLISGDFPNLDQPALALAAPDGNAETGLLTLEDILGLKLDADWIVLSACNTAAGDGAGADAISGLGRGFFYAGSRALLVTHWPVETRSARTLVTEIFQRYAADPALTRAEALRQASLSLMDKAASDPASGKAVFSYAHPLFWAPYALVGDGGR
jgi:CHAT domain-containing protein